MPIRGEGLVADDNEDDEQEDETDAQKVSYVLHPNCGIFDED